MRLPPRWLVTCSVVGALLASGATALTMAPRTDTVAVVDVPTPIVAGPAVTGGRIADLAAVPALRRAEELAQRSAPRPTRTTAPTSTRAAPSPSPEPDAEPSGTAAATPTAEPTDRAEDRVRERCRDGSLEGRICADR